MRVIAGELRGRTFDAPQGRDTRPTTDRVREALFSSVVSLVGDFSGLNVCDAFAGSGAFGIESLSRGADFVTFVERDKKTAQLISRNLAKLNIATRGRVISIDTLKTPQVLAAHGPFDLLFLDPPYKISSCAIAELIDEMCALGMLREGAIIVYEHAIQEKCIKWNDTISLLKEKKYGTTVVSYLTVKEVS